MQIEVKKMQKEDYTQVGMIYQAGIESNQCTFETQVPTWSEWDQGHLKECRFVAVDVLEHEILGWVALSPMSSRWCFRGVAEVSIYLNPRVKGKGIGTLLLETAIESSESCGIWSLFSGIFPENITSIKLHEKCGFHKVGTRERLGESSDGSYRDVVFYERRSQLIG